MPPFTQLTQCRCCGSTDLTKYLDLGLMPMANDLQPTKEQSLEVDKFPLEVLFCNVCSLSQLSIVVDPVLMFSNYVYRSGINAGYVQHCKEMAAELKDKHGLNNHSVVYDIAGNDGTLLKTFKEVIGFHQAYNIDPAENLWKICEKENGVRMFCGFFETKFVDTLLKLGNTKADLITATNVFAHVHDVKDFLTAVYNLLKDDGVLVLEFPYLIDFIDKKEFDTVYFEHLSYFAITPLMWLVTDCGMKIISVSKQDIHGGTVRVTIAKQWAAIPVEQSVDDFITNEEEQGYTNFEKYKDYYNSVDYTVNNFTCNIIRLNKVAAFAASAKGNTLLNSCSITDKNLMYIVDETPEKIGKFSPGTGIEVVTMEKLQTDPPDYLVILSWNFANEIMAKCKAAGYTGYFVIPIPEWQIIQ